jgi:glycosyltransferase involved in cell wall biosynthesis
MLLSASLIVRDEAEKLGRCLRSLVEVVDEIVVVDTGSVDDTVQIAQSFGATVFHRPWGGDFSAARNYGLDRVSGAWVLYVDADEYLAATERSAVEHVLLADDVHVAYRILLRHRRGFTPYFEYRMWRSRPDIRFEGVMHETVVPSIQRAAESNQLRIGVAELLLEHDGYEGDQRHKHERNLPLLQEEALHDPERTYLWDHIGRIQHDVGFPLEARQAWQQGVDIVRRNGIRDDSDSLVFFDLIMSNVEEGRLDHDLVEDSLSLFPHNALIYWSAALHAIADGDRSAAVTLLNRLLSLSPEYIARSGIGMNERVTREWAFHARGMMRFKDGDFIGAAADFGVAEAWAPEIVEYRVKRLLAEAKARP